MEVGTNRRLKKPTTTTFTKISTEKNENKQQKDYSTLSRNS